METASLGKLIAESWQSLETHPKHHLKLGLRRRIWRAYGYACPEAVAHARRTEISCVAAEHVLGIWGRAFPNDDLPRRAILNAREVIKGNIADDYAEAMVGDIDSYLDSLSFHYDRLIYGTAVVAAGATKQALLVSCYGEMLQLDNTDLDADDYDLDAYEWDSSYFASVAFANGHPDDLDSDATKRLAFWRWWLTHAVPNSYVNHVKPGDGTC